MTHLLLDKIQNDLYEAQRSKSDHQIRTLKLLIAAIKNAEIEKRQSSATEKGGISDLDIIKIKSNKNSLEAFPNKQI